MIARITGRLVHLVKDRAHVDPGQGLVYEVLLPAFAMGRLGGAIDQSVTLHTLHFLEGTAQGATMFPRLAGFLTQQDKAFFELFVSVKGIGHRKALRAMALATPQLAGAIADRDLATLQSLPEVGKRTAETIAVTLREKMEPFLGAPAGTATASVSPEVPASATLDRSLTRDALDTLAALGEHRIQAAEWIEQVLSRDNPPTEVQDVVREVYRLKQTL
jgi:Holliday junction DNA helicase RuvA